MPEGPKFGPLSKPVPAAVAAFRQPGNKIPPLVEPAVEYGLTDAGQAHRFAERFGAQFRYDHSRKCWLRWDGNRFALDRDGEVKRQALIIASDLYIEAGNEPNLRTREAIARFAIAHQSRHKVEDVLELAKVLTPIADDGLNWNRDPFLLATPWGVVDLSTGKVRDGRPEDRITLSTTAKFDPTAKCPRWLRFLDEVFLSAGELIAYVQRAAGYSATGDTHEQCVFLLTGDGSNGKSTLLETLRGVLGEYAYASPFSTFEAGQRSAIGSDVAALIGRRFVTSSETNTSARFNEARLKALSGGDTMNARHLYGNPMEFRPVAKIWLAVNHKPAVIDDSYGFWRRIHVIPFTRTFSGSTEDRTLKEQLESEASGILNWFVQGAIAWQKQGLCPPEVVLSARDEYQHDQDPLMEFIEEACRLEAGAVCPASQLWLAYQSWCERLLVKPLGRKMFGALMARRVEWKHMEFGRAYVGIRPKS